MDKHTTITIPGAAELGRAGVEAAREGAEGHGLIGLAEVV